jgi:hypothetical protein
MLSVHKQHAQHPRSYLLGREVYRRPQGEYGRKDSGYRHRYSEHNPLGLLALGRVGDAHIAVELGYREAAPQHEDAHVEEQGWPGGRAERRKSPQTHEDKPAERQPACPARYEAATGKEVEEEHPRQVPDERGHLVQRYLQRRGHRLSRARSKDEQPVQRSPDNEHRGDEQRDGII